MTRRNAVVLVLAVMTGAVVVADIASQVWADYPMIASLVSGGLTLAITIVVVDDVLRRREERKSDQATYAVANALFRMIRATSETVAYEVETVRGLAERDPADAANTSRAKLNGHLNSMRLAALDASAVLALREDGRDLLVKVFAVADELWTAFHWLSRVEDEANAGRGAAAMDSAATGMNLAEAIVATMRVRAGVPAEPVILPAWAGARWWVPHASPRP